MRRKKFRISLLICGGALLALTLLALLGRREAVETGAWGLSFPREGQAPTGTVSESTLEALGARYLGDTKEQQICLTFDCGYENGCTGKILDVLAEQNVRAAFFLVGNYLDTSPELVQRMVSEGHTVGNHTAHHRNMAEIADAETFRSELTEVEEKYREITGQELPKYYRPPQGVYSEENLRQAQALGYKTVFWSLAYVDWDANDQPTAEAAFEKLLPRIHNGAIVLLHATSETNAAILGELLSRWKAMGYTFVTLDEVFSA